MRLQAPKSHRWESALSANPAIMLGTSFPQCVQWGDRAECALLDESIICCCVLNEALCKPNLKSRICYFIFILLYEGQNLF